MAHTNYASIKTVAERDREIESLWEVFTEHCHKELSHECIVNPFLHFQSGTPLTVILDWFGERHSKGLEYIALPKQERKAWDEQTAEMRRREKMCSECMSETCCFNPEGVCLYPLLFGAEPRIDDDGCHAWKLKDEDGMEWPCSD